jgi:hypothetical protein
VHGQRATAVTPAQATASTRAQPPTRLQRLCSRAQGAGSVMQAQPLETLAQMQKETWGRRPPGCRAATAAGRAAWMPGLKAPARMGVGWGRKTPWMGASWTALTWLLAWIPAQALLLRLGRAQVLAAAAATSVRRNLPARWRLPALGLTKQALDAAHATAEPASSGSLFRRCRMRQAAQSRAEMLSWRRVPSALTS